ncbi:uncharacterized protein [Chelonus insularis]|uniref:uncharacterized protein n=1 Tax=Chelonus insularis TaxID=460826 RepID=UPI00158EBD87|nr:uncharacterized protein LOC118067237 [Chelonus insularis]
MELVEVCTQKKYNSPPSYPPNLSLHTKNQTQKCIKKYIQPPKVLSFAPKKIYWPPSARFDAHTTYYESFLKNNTHFIRPKAFRTPESINISNAKFEDGTTHKLAYQPVWEVVKAKPIIPSRRKLVSHGPFETTTTNRVDFIPKYVEKPEIVIPCGNIRTSNAPLDGTTTSGISYIHPGIFKPSESFKPRIKYIPPEEPAVKETTHKLSYQPLPIGVREKYPWAEKHIYKPPEASIEASTTYSENFIEIDKPLKEKPIIPSSNTDWWQGNREFIGVSCYNQDFIPRPPEPVIIKIPDGNIRLSDKKMADETTSKLSYRPVFVQKRQLIRPMYKSRLMAEGSMQSTTTNRIDFQPKMREKPEIVIPSDNIRNSNKPFDGVTTSAMAYMNHGPFLPPQSFKPTREYHKSPSKLEDETVNKLSYKPWGVKPREDYSWARKASYQPPKEPMIGDSTYHSSFGPPGYFIEECENK